ncbi:MAG: hypothetical protein ACFFFC_00695 [Candidatus Thorarchaeota archaeon]
MEGNNIQLIKIPKGSNASGQACVAMICSLDFEYSKQIMGCGLLRTNRIISVLRDYNINCHSCLRKTFPHWRIRLMEWHCNAIVRINWCKDKYHWVLLYRNEIYDPLCGYTGFSFLKEPSSFLKIKNEINKTS